MTEEEANAALDAELTDLGALAEKQPKEKLAIHFYTDPQQNAEKSKKAGRPIFDEVEMIEVRIPGQVDFVQRPVTEEEKQRFPAQYVAFKKNQDQTAASGTPLAQWPLLTKSQVEESKYLGAHTVEQLAEVSDASLQKFGPGWKTIREQARDWLKKAADGALLARLRTELETRDAKIKTLEDMLNKQALTLAQMGANGQPVSAPQPQSSEIAELKAAVASLLAAKPADPAPKRRGRPPKAKPAEVPG